MESNFQNPQISPNPTKFYTHFLYKAVLLSIFLLVIPLFPSQAPDFINQAINTRSWELLQLLFVGIAVSYGLFSKRNDETEKEQGSPKKSDSTQSYVAKLLQVSSVFDDESEPSAGGGSEESSKIQTWNAQYYRGEPIVVVAKENSVLDEQGGGGGGGGGGSKELEKPLLLPVRSLRNGVLESSTFTNGSKEKSLGRSLSSRSDFQGFSRNLSRFRDEPDEKNAENVVFRSPIPWRSRSGRMEVKEDSENQKPPQENSPAINPIESRSFRYQSSKPISNPSSQSKIHPSNPSFTQEIHSKTFEDLRKKPSLASIPPPPPPPPPPPHFLKRYPSENPNQTRYSGKEFRRSTRSFPNENSRSKTEDAENRGKTSRKQREYDDYLTDDKEIERFIETRGQQAKKYEESVAEEKDSEESDDEEEDEFEEISSKNGGEMGMKDDNGPDVDKKADEFIAKFREQIRLQRIASIRRSTTQIPKNGVR